MEDACFPLTRRVFGHILKRCLVQQIHVHIHRSMRNLELWLKQLSQTGFIVNFFVKGCSYLLGPSLGCSLVNVINVNVSELVNYYPDLSLERYSRHGYKLQASVGLPIFL